MQLLTLQILQTFLPLTPTIQAAQLAIAGPALLASRHQLQRPLLQVETLELVALLVEAQEALQEALEAVLEVAQAQVLVMARELARALVAALELVLEVVLEVVRDQAQGRVMATIRFQRKLLQAASVTRNLRAPVMLSSAK